MYVFFNSSSLWLIFYSVYTCQKAQPKRCNFFLWDDDARIREEATVLNNSRSEPLPPPKTPPKPPPDPQTRTQTTESRKQDRCDNQTVYTPSKSSSLKTNPIEAEGEEDAFDWPSSNDEDLLEVSEEGVHPVTMPPPETPRKVARTIAFASPGKRNHQEMENSERSTSTDDVFAPAGTSNELGLPSPAETPTPHRSREAGTLLQDSDLGLRALTLLNSKGVNLDRDVGEQLVDLLSKHELKTQGIIKGRDMSRLAVKIKDQKISELQARVAGLEAERETSKAVIAHLKRDMVTARVEGRSR